MSTYSEWSQLRVTMWGVFSLASCFYTGQWAQSSENMTHIQQSMYILNTLHRHRDAAVALMLCDEFTRKLTQTFRKMHSSFYIVSQTTNLMNDKLTEKKRCSGTRSGQTISLLTVRPQLCAATVFAH